MCNHVTERTRKDTSGKFSRKTSRPANRGPKMVNFYPQPWFPLEHGRGGQTVPTTSAGDKEDTHYVPYRTPPREAPERAQPQSSAGRRTLNLCGKPDFAAAVANFNRSVTSDVRRRSARIAVM
jgi:hypothetical protein